MFDDDWDMDNKWRGSDWAKEYLDDPPPFSEKDFCIHEWKPTLLIISTVYDCVKCGMKKEDYDKKPKNDDWDIPF